MVEAAAASKWSPTLFANPYLVIPDPVKEPVTAPGGLESADVWGDAPDVSTLKAETAPH